MVKKTELLLQTTEAVADVKITKEFREAVITQKATWEAALKRIEKIPKEYDVNTDAFDQPARKHLEIFNKEVRPKVNSAAKIKKVLAKSLKIGTRLGNTVLTPELNALVMFADNEETAYIDRPLPPVSHRKPNYTLVQKTRTSHSGYQNETTTMHLMDIFQKCSDFDDWDDISPRALCELFSEHPSWENHSDDDKFTEIARECFQLVTFGVPNEDGIIGSNGNEVFGCGDVDGNFRGGNKNAGLKTACGTKIENGYSDSYETSWEENEPLTIYHDWKLHRRLHSDEFCKRCAKKLQNAADKTYPRLHIWDKDEQKWVRDASNDNIFLLEKEMRW
tara:strand:- start:2890 stop:3891 length:1002 start_codon:yes stop_codon:yes gene_type:complete